jgi:preprotein translocase subunit SecF
VELIKNTKIDFIGIRYIGFAISAILVAVGLVAMVVRGPNLGIDFVGGTLIQLEFTQPVELDKLRSLLGEKGITNLEMQTLQGNNMIIRVKRSALSESEFAGKITGAVKETLPDVAFTVKRTEFVGPAVGRDLSKKAIFAIIFSMLGIIVYVAFRFHSGVWGFAGVFALMHDVFIVFGIFCLFGREISLTVIAALLTLAGYSINDTIVVFDRMRENLRLMPKMDLGSIINLSINQTLSRTIITSSTVFFVVVSLFFFGGEVIHDFSFAMLIGTVIGVYSSVWVAAPMVYEWEMYKKRKAAQPKLGKK